MNKLQLLLSPWVLSYILTSFIEWDINPGNWGGFTRGLSVALSFTASLVIFGLMVLIDWSKK